MRAISVQAEIRDAALVQTVIVTSDAAGAAHELASELGMSVNDVLAAPFVLIGTDDEIVASDASTR